MISSITGIRALSRRHKRKKEEGRRPFAFLHMRKDAGFASRVFANEQERNAWIQKMTETGRKNYDALMKKRAQLSSHSPNAGTTGSAPTFDVDKKRRKKTKAFEAGIKTAMTAGEFDRDVSAPGVTSQGAILQRTEDRVERRSYAKGRGAPEWVSVLKGLRKPTHTGRRDVSGDNQFSVPYK